MSGLGGSSSGCGDRLFGLGFAGQHAAVELMNDAGNVSLRLAVGRNSMVFVNRLRTGVISSKRKGKVVVVAREQGIKIDGSSADIFFGLEAVLHAQSRRG